MTGPDANDAALRRLARRAHDEDPDRVDFDVVAGLSDVVDRALRGDIAAAAAPTGAHATIEDGQLAESGWLRLAVRTQVPATGRSANRVTLDEVAARAGVGRGTVSRVVNGSVHVSAAARAAVEKAIGELGYVPSRAARPRVQQRTGAVALVVSESEERVIGDSYFADILRGINAVLRETPLQLWLAMAQSEVERERVDRHLTPQHVDGALLLSVHSDDPLPTLLARRGLAVVIAGRLSVRALADPGARVSCVDADNAGGARTAVAHLLTRGRRRIATIAGPQDTAAGLARLAGYRQALRAAGLTVDESLVEYGDFAEAAGATAMRALLARHPDLDAVFAATDAMAAGAMRVLVEQGRHIPVQVAVIGFGDHVGAPRTDPALTTIREPVEAIGQEMARLLVARLRAEDTPAASVLHATELVVRAST